MENCPTEILLYIFELLKLSDLTKCREVCSRWRITIDGLCTSDRLWQKHCEKDFTAVFKIAHYKSNLSWYKLYRSLSLWSKLPRAIEEHDEFASASRLREEIRDFQILTNGEIGVHTRAGIVYYNIRTCRESGRNAISGNHLRYLENDEVIIILGFNLDLYIERKIIKSPQHASEAYFSCVKNFLLNSDELYYVSIENNIYKCRLDTEEILSNMLIGMPSEVVCLGYTNGNLHALTFEREIFTVMEANLQFKHMLQGNQNLLHVLKEYNFLEHLDWRVYIQWMFVLNCTIPLGFIRDIIVVKIYGDVVFVGTNSGVLRIYHSPYSTTGFDLFNTDPVKQYNFTERTDCPVLSNSPVIQVDVIEGEDSHTVLVAMPKKIAVLNFRHEIPGPFSHPFEVPDEQEIIDVVN